jgi:hypothetical protein
LEDGEGWYYIAEGTRDLLGTDPLVPDMRVLEAVKKPPRKLIDRTEKRGKLWA